MAVCPTCKATYDPAVRICPNDGTPLTVDVPPDPNLGSLLEGKYRIDAFISSGGMGSVYRGTHVMLDKTVAIKLVRKELVTTPDIGARFQREARAASTLGHPNIASVSDFGQSADGTLYLVMEFVKGASLRDVIRSGGPMAPARVIAILQPITSALARAHRQHIIHRDLKPHNIMLDVDADGVETPKLLDFGIAKTFDESASQLTMTGFALGTPQYMSPEQATGTLVDERSDLYSLGVVLYEMLIGEVPFSDTSLTGILLKQMTELPVPPSVRRPDLQISPALESIALRCLEKDPVRRFQTAEELFEAFEQVKDASAANRPTIAIPVPVDGDPTMVIARTPGPPPLPKPVQVQGPSVSSPPLASTGTAPTRVVPISHGAPVSAPPRSRGAIWIPVVAAATVIVLAVGVWGLRGPASSSTESSPALAPASTPAAAQPDTMPAPPPASAPPERTAPVAAPGATETPTTRPLASSTPATPPAAVTTPASSPPTGAVASGQTRPAPTVPDNPSVFVQCSGPGEVCSPMRSAFSDALTKDHMTLAPSAGRANVVLSIGVEVVEELATQSFGSTFVTRTYSAEVDGEAGGLAVPMPAGRSFSFDARVGRERANENARLLASDTIEKVRAFWEGQR